MDARDEQADPASGSEEQQQSRNAYVDNAIRAIRQKKPLPEIDFTIHTMEDGTQVNTTERVCKGRAANPLTLRLLLLLALLTLALALALAFLP